ncbi:MAG: GNAT family N-acetyltransferase [Methylovirgula sp.]|uniref:GNAT family N-acetyltransferase n=1 Tax=Methylovirgula sp. TaxID=1978224 RepID=UPI0030765FF1
MSSVIDFYPSTAARRLRLVEGVTGRVFAKVEVHRALDAVEADWAELEVLASASIYQTRAFVVPWLETLGAARKIAPLFVTAKDSFGRTIALLCLGVRSYGWFRVASFLGGRESNFNFGLFRPGSHFSPADLRALLREAAKVAGKHAPDVFVLKNQPYEWNNAQNPFAFLPHRPSPSAAYATELGSDAAAFLKSKLSKDTQKKLRKKEARLAEMGPVELITGEDPENARLILDAFFFEKIRRCEEKAITSDFAAPSMRSFFESLCRHENTSANRWLELYGLALGGRIIATYIGAAHGGHFSAMVNSFDSDPEIAKSSPGDLLLMKLIAAQCTDDRTSFDLGIGEARYKMTYCDIKVPLFDIVMPLGAKGYAVAARQAICSRLKTAIKERPQVFAALRQAKYFVAHRRLAGASSLSPKPSPELSH